MPDLRGARVGLLESRMEGELASLVRRYGGEPVSAPSVREAPLAAGPETAAFIDAIIDGRISVVILLTAVAVTALLREAEAASSVSIAASVTDAQTDACADAAVHPPGDRLAALLEGLRRAITVCRGPKPTGVLARHGVPVGVRVPSPHTTADVIRALDTVPLAGRTAGLLHYGERNETIAEALRARGAQVEELCLYEWRLPDDTGPLRTLAREVIDGRIDAVAFTSQIQVRHLLRVAETAGQRDALVSALNARATIAAVGPTCAAALLAEGITPDVVANPPKMGPMLAALAAHLEARS